MIETLLREGKGDPKRSEREKNSDKRKGDRGEQEISIKARCNESSMAVGNGRTWRSCELRKAGTQEMRKGAVAAGLGQGDLGRGRKK